MADAVDWEVARSVAGRAARRGAPTPAYELRALEADFRALTARAEAMVTEETGLVPDGPARARVTDRAGWVDVNIASFQRLLRPVTEKLAEAATRSSGPLSLPPAVSRRVAGTQVGLLLGWMSSRVLGQYDQLLIEDDRADEQDVVVFVGPNVLDLERRYGFPPHEFRLWLALHEVTHRAQFTGVPWMRAHFLGLVEGTLAGIDPDPRRLLDAVGRAARAVLAGRNPLDDGGLLGLVATEEQRGALDRIGGLMSLLEGHGDVTMDRAGADAVPSAARFSRTLHERRQRRGPARVLTSLIGLDAKLRQYEEGERFIDAVEAVGGPELLARVWEGPDALPSWPEIRDPERWVRRMAPDHDGAGVTAPA
ncbi:MAG TPA: zinc-dependent metalloprotease [Acidimicrobiales bacterium]|nr:zinc-dependent metalloprotease [Acidimicrobiales bacterium]